MNYFFGNKIREGQEHVKKLTLLTLL